MLGHVNQFGFVSDEKSVFQSYNSICAIIDWEKSIIKLGRDWDYSKTTMKHLRAFFYDNCINLNCKKDAEKALKDGVIGNYKIIEDLELK